MQTYITFSKESFEFLLEELTEFHNDECLRMKQDRELMAQFYNEPKEAFDALFPNVARLLKVVPGKVVTFDCPPRAA